MNRIVSTVIGISGSAFLMAGAVGIVRAATMDPTTKDVGSSGIALSDFKQDKIEAMAKVLNKSDSQIISAMKNKTLSSLIKTSKLSHKVFTSEVKTDLITDLENDGYSHDQIIIAMQQKTIDHLRKEVHHK